MQLAPVCADRTDDWARRAAAAGCVAVLTTLASILQQIRMLCPKGVANNVLVQHGTLAPGSQHLCAVGRRLHNHLLLPPNEDGALHTRGSSACHACSPALMGGHGMRVKTRCARQHRVCSYLAELRRQVTVVDAELRIQKLVLVLRQRPLQSTMWLNCPRARLSNKPVWNGCKHVKPGSKHVAVRACIARLTFRAACAS